MASAGKREASTTGPAGRRASPELIRDALLILLASASGYIDAVSYLRLGHVFTANMTGNTVLLGLDLVQSNLASAGRSGMALAGFVVGVGIGAPIVQRRDRHGIWPATVTLALAVEMLVLAAFAAAGALAGANPSRVQVFVFIALASIAMGIQSVAVRALDVRGVTTTYIGGTWTSLVTRLSVWARLARREPAEPRAEEAAAASAGMRAMLLGTYLASAAVGGAAAIRWHLAAITGPALALALVVVVAAARLHHR